jgi:large subunit ribosomal protein L18
MISKKNKRRNAIRSRIRRTIIGSEERPRLSVYRSNKQIYAQVIDDLHGNTLISASSAESALNEQKITKIEKANLVGKIIAEKALAAGITEVVFDRGGYLYHGRVKSLADGAREGGLKF